MLSQAERLTQSGFRLMIETVFAHQIAHGSTGMPILMIFLIPAALLVGFVSMSAFLLLEPCAVNLSFLDRYGVCPDPAEAAADLRLAALDQDRIAIERDLYDLERELAGVQCLASGPDPRRPFVEQGWDNAMLPMLFGCWDISLGYETRDIDTNAVIGYTDWQVCFDTKGQGREIMRDDAGIVCEGPVSAVYGDAGLLLSEPENLACSDGGYVAPPRDVMSDDTGRHGSLRDASAGNRRCC